MTTMIDGVLSDNTKLVAHHIESYNDFVDQKINDIICGFNPIVLYHDFDDTIQDFRQITRIVVSNPRMNSPLFQHKDGSNQMLVPDMARLRNLTYASCLSVDMSITNTVTPQEQHVTSVLLGSIPVMLKSKMCNLSTGHSTECPLDLGGYFIVHGNEKCLVSQERIADNKTLIFKPPPGKNPVASVRSSNNLTFSVPKLFSLTLNEATLTIEASGQFLRTSAQIPLFVLFRALGVESDLEILHYILLDDPLLTKNDRLIDILKQSIEAAETFTQQTSIDFIARVMIFTGQPKQYIDQPTRINELVMGVLQTEFLPHTGPLFCQKALYLGYMTHLLLATHLGYRDWDDRDSYINKRLNTSGALMSSLFRQCYGKIIKDMKTMLQRDPAIVLNAENIQKYVKSKIVDTGFHYALSTGNWGLDVKESRQGISQSLSRLTYIGTLSHLRRVSSYVDKTGKMLQPRKLHISQFGIVCPAETPEGGAVGLVKNLAITTQVTTASRDNHIATMEQMEKECGVVLSHTLLESTATSANRMRSLKEMGNPLHVCVMLNGNMIGYHRVPNVLYQRLKQMKDIRSDSISVFWNITTGIIHVNTDDGRMRRPLHNLATYTIEYMDVEEINHAMVALFPVAAATAAAATSKSTHCELHPMAMYGVMAGSIPFSNHNQAPRNCYQASMGKQAIGIYASNFNRRFDTVAHVLHYPQKPLARTRVAKHIHVDDLPSGINAIVAIMTYSGFNQEDSVIVNKSAVDRGLFCSTHFKTHKDVCLRNALTREEQFFCHPNVGSDPGLHPSRHGPDGFIKKNERVTYGDALVGKTMGSHIGETNEQVRNVKPLGKGETGYIDAVLTGTNGEGYTFSKIKTRDYRRPTVGDKFASFAAQKGTLGMLYSQEDMPFTKDGLVPDIIMNPHAIPSRMTIGQLMECVMGKAGVAMGRRGDASPFNGCGVEDIATLLERSGLQRHGNEIMYDGRTGRQMNVDIFIGPTYYQRLKHMVADKVYARSSVGPVTMLTRQPAEGRARAGGLRFGEMEKDCVLGHGAASFLKERMLDLSDNYRGFVCHKCGMFAIANPEQNLFICKGCADHDVRQVRLPYACKLLFQELEAMNINCRMQIEK